MSNTKTAIAPRKANFSLGGLRSSVNQIGSGGGGGGDGRFLKIAHKTGEMTLGANKEPFNKDVDYAIRVEEIRIGYYIYEGKGMPDKTNMVPMVSGKPKPVPPVPYAKYPEDGPVDIVEIKLHPVSGNEGPVEFAPTGVSSQNRIANLTDAIIRQSELPAGQAGFINPIITVKTDFWVGDYGETHHFDYIIRDWVDASGELRQSVWEATGQVTDQSGTEEAVIDAETGEIIDEEFDPMG